MAEPLHEYNNWGPFEHRRSDLAVPGTYYVQGGVATSPHRDPQDPEPRAGHWFSIEQPLARSDIGELTSIQLITHARNTGPEGDDGVGSRSWFQLAIQGRNANSIKKLPSGQSLAWLSHSNWFKADIDGNNDYQWCRGRMFTKDDEIFKYLKEGAVISVWISAARGYRNEADRGYLVFGFGGGPGKYRTPVLRQTPNDQRLISVFAQEKQECLMIPADDFSTEVKANVVGSGIELMERLLTTEDNDWRLSCHSLGPVNPPAPGPAAQLDGPIPAPLYQHVPEPAPEPVIEPGPVPPNFDSAINLAQRKEGSKKVERKGANPSLQVAKESTITGRPRENFEAQQVPEGSNIIVWDDSGVIKGQHGNEILNANHVLSPSATVLIYQMHAPLWTGALWRMILDQSGLDPIDEDWGGTGRSKTKTKERKDRSIIVVIDADDLRADGIRISRGISWEKTMEDFRSKIPRIHEKMAEKVQHLDGYERYVAFLKTRVNLLVRCGYEGVLHLRPRRHEDPEHPFVFHAVPDMAEGDLLRSYGGRMSGIHMAFVTGLVASIARHPAIAHEAMGRSQIGAAVELAIIWSHRFASMGFYEEPNGGLNFPEAKDINTYRASKTKVIYDDNFRMAHPNWSLFNLLGPQRESVAAEVVRLGTKYVQGSVPTAQYGNLLTADRTEIEGYRSTAAVIHEYLRGKTDKPLSIGVFGQPGSGKSFGVKQVITSALQDYGQDECDPIEANLSQFMDYSDLVGIFRQVRETTMKHRIPVVLFDEFDSALQKEPLAWLKYFLAPMQDGQFLDSGIIRQIGRAIFVFIGGTSSTFKNFSKNIKEPVLDEDEEEEEEGGQNPPAENPPQDQVAQEKAARRERVEKARLAKKPDFVSRLSAHIDIRGPNRIRPQNPAQNQQGQNQNQEFDRMFIVRRAILLQSMLKRRFGADVDKIKVDEGVLKAMLKHEPFSHGARSMELILATSRLSGYRTFESSALPADDQLVMHVMRTNPFYRLVDLEDDPIPMPPTRPIDVDLYNKLLWARM